LSTVLAVLAGDIQLVLRLGRRVPMAVQFPRLQQYLLPGLL